MTDISKIQPTYIIFERDNAINIQNQLRDIRYNIDMSQDEETKIDKIWLDETDRVIEIKQGREFKINEKLYMVQRYLHNELNISYKNVIDIEILYSENKTEDHTEDHTEYQRIVHRYPNEGRNAIDFQATLLDTFVDCNLNRQNIINGYKKMYVMVMISNERQIIGEVVSRYLFIESIESRESIDPYIPSNHIPRSVSRRGRRNGISSNMSPNISEDEQLSFQQISPPGADLSINWGDIFNGQTGSFQALPHISDDQKINYDLKIQDLETKREDELNNIRQTFFNNTNNTNNNTKKNTNNNTNNWIIGEDINPYVTYNRNSRNSRNSSVFGNVINLLQHVNYDDYDDYDDFNIENLLEPVRVTINEEKLETFLTSFKYGDGNVEKNIKIKDQLTCPICLSEFEQDENVSYINSCNHLFHTPCLNKWLREFNHKCPICRTSADPSKNII